ncbi:hypothetical protein VP01_10837g2, partial [Puccinia sorghi]
LYLMKSRSNTMPLKHLDWNPTSKKILAVLLAIYPSLSPNLPKNEDNDASPFIWIPIKQTTCNLVEEKFEVKGGEFVFPDESCGINFSGLNGIVECSWKAMAL